MFVCCLGLVRWIRLPFHRIEAKAEVERRKNPRNGRDIEWVVGLRRAAASVHVVSLAVAIFGRNGSSGNP